MSALPPHTFAPWPFGLRPSQLRQYEEEPDETGGACARGTPPLRLDRCMHLVGETPTLTEPLPHLLRAIALCIRCAEDEVLSQSDDTVSQADEARAAPGVEYALPGLDALRERLRAVVVGFHGCTLADFQLGGDKVEMTQKKEGGGGPGLYNCATARLLKATLEALLEWCVLCELPSEPSAEPMELEPIATQASQVRAGSALEQTMQARLPAAIRALFALHPISSAPSSAAPARPARCRRCSSSSKT
jgi:hypothetical protein